MNDTDQWKQLTRPLPEWFDRSVLGLFIHWGPYSVPAWAEPVAELGSVADDLEWFTHNPYSEWYMNTIAIDGSPAQQHHQQRYGGMPYDEFLDMWGAENFDADELLRLFSSTGADYVIPTTKHHDGVALWDAPGTGTRNTVHRGPRRDLIAEFHAATLKQGLRFGVYYSGGLDWHHTPSLPHVTFASLRGPERPNGEDYAEYAATHIRDLIARFDPAILWDDITWPDAGKDFGPHGLGTLFGQYYAALPDGVVNDRWRVPHWDFRTSEYQSGREVESEGAWEHTRGVGLSFGYNQVEGPEHSITGRQAAQLLADAVSRGGRLLLNVGLKADGSLPQLQRDVLEELGQWMRVAKSSLAGSRPVAPGQFRATGDAWIRTVSSEDGSLACFVDSADSEAVEVSYDGAVEPTGSIWGVLSQRDATSVRVALAPERPGPAIVWFEK